MILVGPWRVLALLLAAQVLPAQDAPPPSAAVQLSPPLAQWKEEIEAVRGSKVVLARVFTDRARNEILLPEDAGERPILRQYFLNPAFLAEFVHMHAANLNHIGDGGLIHFILLNMARAEEWAGHEDAVLAHELGHVWLFVNDYPAPAFEGRDDSCVAIQAGDAVQHVLIREEIRRRGIDFLPFWRRNLHTQLETLLAHPPDAFTGLPLCRQVSLLTQWVDVRLGLSPETWEDYDRFSEAMARCFPRLAPAVDELAGLIGRADLRDPETYARVQRQVLVRMYQFAAALRDAPISH